MLVGLAATAAAQPVIQIGGDDSINVAGNDNVVVRLSTPITINNTTVQVVVMPPKHWIRQIERAVREDMQKEMRATAEAAVSDKLAELKAQATPDAARALQTTVESSPEIEAAVEDRIKRTLALQEQISSLGGTAHDDAHAALEDADLETVNRILVEEHIRQSQYNRIGGLGSFISSKGGAYQTAALGFTADGITDGRAAVSTRGAALWWTYWGASFNLGVTSTGTAHDTYFSLPIMVGPRLRLGLPTSLVLWLYYYCPVVEREAERWRFPLVGAGASLGVQWPSVRIDATYRFSTSRPLYADGFDSHQFGIVVTAHVGGHQ